MGLCTSSPKDVGIYEINSDPKARADLLKKLAAEKAAKKQAAEQSAQQQTAQRRTAQSKAGNAQQPRRKQQQQKRPVADRSTSSKPLLNGTHPAAVRVDVGSDSEHHDEEDAYKSPYLDSDVDNDPHNLGSDVDENANNHYAASGSKSTINEEDSDDPDHEAHDVEIDHKRGQVLKMSLPENVSLDQIDKQREIADRLASQRRASDVHVKNAKFKKMALRVKRMRAVTRALKVEKDR